MTTRIVGIPDQDGVIKIICGGVIVEIQIAAPTDDAAMSAQPQYVLPPRPSLLSPFDKPFYSQYLRPFAVDFRHNIGDNLSALTYPFISSTAETGAIDIDGIVNQVGVHIADPQLQNPQAIILGVEYLNPHELTKFGLNLAKVAPDIPIAIDFRSHLWEK